MTKHEWAAICADLQATWPGVELRPATVAIWWEDVAELDATVVRAALVSYRRDGREFPPTGGMLRKRAGELAGTSAPPDPDKAFALVNEAIRRLPGEFNSEARQTWLEYRDPRAAEVARIVGWDYLRGTGPDEYHEPSVRRAFRDSYAIESDREHTRRHVAELGGTAPQRLSDVIARTIGSGEDA